MVLVLLAYSTVTVVVVLSVVSMCIFDLASTVVLFDFDMWYIYVGFVGLDGVYDLSVSLCSWNMLLLAYANLLLWFMGLCLLLPGLIVLAHIVWSLLVWWVLCRLVLLDGLGVWAARCYYSLVCSPFWFPQPRLSSVRCKVGYICHSQGSVRQNYRGCLRPFSYDHSGNLPFSSRHGLFRSFSGASGSSNYLGPDAAFIDGKWYLPTRRGRVFNMYMVNGVPHFRRRAKSPRIYLQDVGNWDYSPLRHIFRTCIGGYTEQRVKGARLHFNGSYRWVPQNLAAFVCALLKDFKTGPVGTSGTYTVSSFEVEPCTTPHAALEQISNVCKEHGNGVIYFHVDIITLELLYVGQSGDFIDYCRTYLGLKPLSADPRGLDLQLQYLRSPHNLCNLTEGLCDIHRGYCIIGICIKELGGSDPQVTRDRMVLESGLMDILDPVFNMQHSVSEGGVIGGKNPLLVHWREVRHTITRDYPSGT